MTNDVPDFTAIYRRWPPTAELTHASSSSRMPACPGVEPRSAVFVGAIDALLSLHPGEDAFKGRVHWLL